MEPNDRPALVAKIHAIHEALLAFYGEPERKPVRSPLDELVMTILSQNTADVNTARAFASLKEQFPEWSDVLQALPDRVIEAIRIGGLGNIKGPRIQKILAQLQEERGELSLDFLSDLSVSEARDYLTALYGVGPKTAACVLLFSLKKPALPVDTHVHRIALRLELVPPRTSAEATGPILESLLPTDLYYPFHLNVIRHGRTLCKAQRPLCDECPLTGFCGFYASREAAASPGEG